MNLQYPAPPAQPRFDLDDVLPKCEGKPSRDFRLGGVAWRVCEDRCPIRALPCLIFYGPGEARRVFSYPSDWQTLSEAQLWALSWLR
ncbi:MAG: hypothetical protein JF602_00275 [Gemmatimonadetes bacterium]|nr:hypothetical protein [Gemmatimonadota bacterium]